jgi:hypothetical protein
MEVSKAAACARSITDENLPSKLNSVVLFESAYSLS